MNWVYGIVTIWIKYREDRNGNSLISRTFNSYILAFHCLLKTQMWISSKELYIQDLSPRECGESRAESNKFVYCQ